MVKIEKHIQYKIYFVELFGIPNDLKLNAAS